MPVYLCVDQVLLETAADPAVINASGQTPKDIAKLAGHRECARVLANYSIKPIKQSNEVHEATESYNSDSQSYYFQQQQQQRRQKSINSCDHATYADFSENNAAQTNDYSDNAHVHTRESYVDYYGDQSYNTADGDYTG